eukprot:3461156-Pleurochrysis_carterae.AAC.2
MTNAKDQRKRREGRHLALHSCSEAGVVRLSPGPRKSGSTRFAEGVPPAARSRKAAKRRRHARVSDSCGDKAKSAGAPSCVAEWRGGGLL